MPKERKYIPEESSKYCVKPKCQTTWGMTQLVRTAGEINYQKAPGESRAFLQNRDSLELVMNPKQIHS